MNEKTAVAIMRTFESARPASSAVVTKAWKWAAGVHVFPEAVCPFCKVIMRSVCLWWVNESAQQLRAIVGIDGTKLIRMPPTHPHVHSNGTSICMNGESIRSAQGVASALFLAIYPQSTMNGFGPNRQYGRWNVWFKDYFGHTEHSETGLKRRSRPSLAKLFKEDKPAKRAVARKRVVG